MRSPEWDDFNVFSQWAKGHGYREGRNHSVIRIETDREFSPDNCIVVFG